MSGLIEEMTRVTAEPFPDMINAVNTLRGRGLRTALLTNNWFANEQEQLANQTVISSYFGPMFDVVS